MVGASFTVEATALIGRVQKSITAVGNAQISTAQSKFGGSSLALDGTGDKLEIPYSSDLTLSTTNWTVEYWIRITAQAGNYTNTIGMWDDTTASGCAFYFSCNMYDTTRAMGVQYFYGGNNSGPVVFGSTLTTGTWQHHAFVKNGNTLTAYKDGVSQGTHDMTGRTISPYDSNYVTLKIGGLVNGGYLNGYMDEIRISSVARYTSNFTAPTAAFSNDANTVLLIHADGTNGSTLFTDDNSLAVTPAASSINEGSSLTFNVTSVGAPDQTLYYTLSNAGDFSTSSGSFSLTSNAGSFSVTPTADTTTEGAETFTASIRTGSTSGPIVATSSAVTINDTSLTPVVSGSWTSYGMANVVSSISQYTGLGKSSIGIHGVQNTDNLVVTLATQNSARTSWSLTPMVINLTSGAIAKGSTTSITATNTGANYWTANACGDDTGAISYGVFSVGHYDGAKYVHRMYGFNFTNWGSISPTTVPTISLSSAYTDTQQLNGEINTTYAGGGRWVSVWRDNAAGDLTAFKAYTYTGSGTPSAYSVKSAGGGNRGSGPIASWRNGITVGTNFAAHSAQAGNNNNPLVTFVTTGNASNCKNYSKGDVIASDSRAWFDGDTLRDVSSSWFFIHGARKGSTNQHEIYAGQVTNANSPTATPTVTYGAVNNSGTDGALVSGDKATKAYKTVQNSGNMQVTPITLDTGTRALTLGTAVVATGSVANGNNAYRGFYHSTYGQWIINGYWDGNANLYFSKLNP
jgi:hypothetical protein